MRFFWFTEALQKQAPRQRKGPSAGRQGQIAGLSLTRRSAVFFAGGKSATRPRVNNGGHKPSLERGPERWPRAGKLALSLWRRMLAPVGIGVAKGVPPPCSF